MTDILLSQIRITSNQIIAKINNIDRYLELFDLAQLMQHITEKTITILSREYHKHNDLESFRNNYMLTLSQLLDNINYKQFPEKYEYKDKKTDYCVKRNMRINNPYWVIEDQHWTKGNSFIITTLRNIANERLEDN